MSQAKRQQNIAGYREAAWKIVGIPPPPFHKSIASKASERRGGVGINSMASHKAGVGNRVREDLGRF